MDEEISRFRAELKLRAARDMCRRFLIFGSCMQLDDDNYYGLKAAVAEQFQIHPNEIIVVGSAKLGFSIAPTKRYRAFGETSDIGCTKDRLFFDMRGQFGRENSLSATAFLPVR